MTALLPLDLPRSALRRGREKIVVGFAGGGGSCEGIKMALGRAPDEALNHDPEAIAMHMVNHPETRHWCQNIWQADPYAVADGVPIGLAWFSPDCKHFSKAKGAAPRARNIRDLAWVVVAYAKLPKHLRPRVLMVENVEECKTWGPLDADGVPIKARAGETFKAWVRELRRLGYAVEWRERRAYMSGAPTIRRRLYIIARCDGRPIVWPKAQFGDPATPEVQAGALPPWNTAADKVIDWSIPCPSIFERTRPLKPATCRRIARGIVRYVLEAAEPFIIPVTHSGDLRSWPVSDPVRTVTSAKRGEFALISPSLVQTGYGEREGQAPRCLDLHRPLGTVVAGGGKHALVAAFLAKHYGGTYQGAGAPVDGPMHTVTVSDHHALTAVHMLNLRGAERNGRDVREPLATVTASGTHAGCVAAFLTKYYGQGGTAQAASDPLHTLPTKARFGLVTVTIGGDDWVLSDIGMRMLVPREGFRAQGFPDSYKIDIEHEGKPLSKAAQWRMCGNSVCPTEARDLAAANVPELAVTTQPMEAAE